MQLSQNYNDRYLNELRHGKGLNPFSFRFEIGGNHELLERAKENNASANIQGIIACGNYFHTAFHLPLVQQLSGLLVEANLNRQEIIQLFVSLINCQHIGIKKKSEQLVLQKESFSAADIENASMISEEFPESINNLKQMSEDLIEYGNLLLNHMAAANLNLVDSQVGLNNEDEVFNILAKVFGCLNKYFLVKNFYDKAIAYSGDIRFENDGSIYFDIGPDELYKVQTVSNMIIGNQRLNRWDYYRYFEKNNLLDKFVPKQTADVTLNKAWVEGGMIVYSLREITTGDYKIYLDYLLTIYDYYSFYSTEVLYNLNELTITKLLQLHSQLKHLVAEIFHNEYSAPEKDGDVASFKMKYLPKMTCSGLTQYLTLVTGCTALQAETFIQLMTFGHSVKSNLYTTPLLRNNGYVFFPYLPVTDANYLFLIDYWLDEAGISLAKRGKALEGFMMERLMTVPYIKYNRFKVISQSKFKAESGFQEIDLLIETKKTLIVGEIKCVKYTMYERDYPTIYKNAILEAESQLNIKSKFLVDNKLDFESLNSISGKKIIKVIILNYPIFTGTSIKGIPIIDYNYFSAYFQSNRIVKRSSGQSTTEETGEIILYQNEEEFCDNFEGYLLRHPVVDLFSAGFRIQKSSIKMEGLPTFSFNNIYPVDSANIWDKKR